jgi:hypothetical protein
MSLAWIFFPSGQSAVLDRAYRIDGWTAFHSRTSQVIGNAPEQKNRIAMGETGNSSRFSKGEGYA